MKVIRAASDAPGFVPEVAQIVGIELTRRNLERLLAKLDHNDAINRGVLEGRGILRSEVRIIDPTGSMYVQGVEDDEHYSDRSPGPMLDNATGKVV